MKPYAIILLSLFAATLSAGASADTGILNLSVSGNPVGHEALKGFIAETIRESITDEADISVSFAPTTSGIPEKLGPGESRLVSATVNKTTPVSVVAKNIGLESQDDSRLLISNDPEQIDGEGTLFSEELGVKESVRLLYYHRCNSRDNLMICVSVHNPNTYPIDIFSTKGLGGPTQDGIYAGHMATKRFMEQESTEAGRVKKIQPGSFAVLACQPLKMDEVSTGIVRIRQVSGRGAVIRITATKKGRDIPLHGSTKNFREDGRLSGSIEQAYVDINENFALGPIPLDIRIGEGPTFISKRDGFDLHLGNYAIIHRIKIKVTNDSDRDKKAAIYYVSAGGPVRGIFDIDGEILETGLLDPSKNKSEKITSVKIPRGGARKISIKMMPQPGSYYPTRFVLLEET